MKQIITIMLVLLLVSCSGKDEVNKELKVTLNVPTEAYETEILTLSLEVNKSIGDVEMSWSIPDAGFLHYPDAPYTTFHVPDVDEETTFQVRVDVRYQDQKKTEYAYITVKNELNAQVSSDFMDMHNITNMADEAFLKLADSVSKLLKTIKKPNGRQELFCANESYTNSYMVSDFIDNDNSNGFSAGDSLGVTFYGCQDSRFIFLRQGKLNLEFTRWNSADDFEVTASSDNLGMSINNNTAPSTFQFGATRIDIKFTDDTLTTNVEAIEESLASGRQNDYIDFTEQFSIKSYQVSKEIDLISASVSVSSSGKLNHSDFQTDFEFEQLEPWQAPLKESPESGKRVFKTKYTENTYEVGTAENYYSPNANLIAMFQSVDQFGRLCEACDSKYYALKNYVLSFSLYDAEFHTNTNSYNENTIKAIGFSQHLNFLDPLEPFRIYFNQNIEGTTANNQQWQVGKNAAPRYISEDIQVFAHNNYLEFVPYVPVSAGRNYSFDRQTLYTENGFPIQLSSLWLKSTNYFTLDIASTSRAYNGSLTPSLSVELENAPFIDYADNLTLGDTQIEWIDTHNVGLSFSNPNEESTDIEIPTELQNDFWVTVKATHEGNSVSYANVRIDYLPNTDNLIYIAGTENDHLTAGDSHLLLVNSSNTLVNIHSAYGTSIRYEDSEKEFEFKFRIDGEEEHILKPGNYVNATSDNSTSGQGHYMSVTSDTSTYCFKTSGSFQVLDVVYSENSELISLAIDAIQYCEGTSNHSKSFIRYNSDVPIEP